MAFETLTIDRNPLELDYWLGYSISAFEYVPAQRQAVVLVSYEDCCLHARDVLKALSERLEIPDDGALPRAAALFRDTPSSRGGDVQVGAELFDRANRLHSNLFGSAFATSLRFRYHRDDYGLARRCPA